MKAKTPNSRSAAALRAWGTRRTPQYRARRTEAASKAALQQWCRANNWKLVVFESASGAPRTGIVDAVMVRIKPGKPDAIEMRLVQLKAGLAGLTAAEVTRMKKAATAVSTDWLLVAYDGTTLHLVPDVPRPGERGVEARRRSPAGNEKRDSRRAPHRAADS
jgi:hypothetical protein